MQRGASITSSPSAFGGHGDKQGEAHGEIHASDAVSSRDVCNYYKCAFDAVSRLWYARPFLSRTELRRERSCGTALSRSEVCLAASHPEAPVDSSPGSRRLRLLRTLPSGRFRSFRVQATGPVV